MKKIFQAEIESIRQILCWILNQLKGLEFSKGDLKKIELASEETIVNIIHHAYLDCVKPIEIEIVLFSTKGYVEIRIKDYGPPFNPLSINTVDFSSDLAERKIGGLGIHFIKKCVDEIRYERSHDANLLVLVKKSSIHFFQKR